MRTAHVMNWSLPRILDVLATPCSERLFNSLLTMRRRHVGIVAIAILLGPSHSYLFVSVDL